MTGPVPAPKLDTNLPKKVAADLGQTFPAGAKLVTGTSTNTFQTQSNKNNVLDLMALQQMALQQRDEMVLQTGHKGKLDVTVIETWINQTLQEAEYFNIPGAD